MPKHLTAMFMCVLRPVCTLATMDDMPIKNALALLKDDYKDIGAILQVRKHLVATIVFNLNMSGLCRSSGSLQVSS
jgi:hypothetical protein